MATGPAGSTYAQVGQRYREILARDGVRLRLVPTNGAVDNIRLLADPRSGIGAGFVQSGTVAEKDARNVVSLGAVFYQEAWLFCRCRPEPGVGPGQWDGRRLSIGPEGSASRPLALRLLALNGIDAQRLHLFAYLPEQAGQALLAGQLDAVLIVSGWDAAVVQSLIRAPDIQLLGFPRADAYVALFPLLNKLVLPAGVADLAANRPPQDTPLIASKASLAVRNNLHPALQFLLWRAAVEVHGRPGVFQRVGEFPAPEELDLPISDAVRQFYRSGPSFLQRTLPFWLAEFVQRMLLLIVPIAGIVYPLWSLAPKIYYWERRRRLYPMYRELKLVELDLQARGSGTPDALIRRLDDLDQRARDLTMPALFNESIFTLRGHIAALRERVQAASR